MYNKIKRELHATDCKCFNQTLHGRSVAVFWLSNVHKMAIKTIFSLRHHRRKNLLQWQ